MSLYLICGFDRCKIQKLCMSDFKFFILHLIISYDFWISIDFLCTFAKLLEVSRTDINWSTIFIVRNVVTMSFSFCIRYLIIQTYLRENKIDFISVTHSSKKIQQKVFLFMEKGYGRIFCFVPFINVWWSRINLLLGFSLHVMVVITYM